MSHGLSTRFSFPLRLPWSQESTEKTKTDASVKSEVEEAMRHCQSLKSDRIRVRVKHRAVYLHGMVSSW